MSERPAENETKTDRRARMYRLEAAVLRRRNLGESDRILTVFSRELGKHRFVAKGVRRPGSKLAGHSEPFMISRFMLARTRGLPILSQVETRSAYPRLRLDERAIAVAGLIAERVDVLTAEDEAAPNVFSLVENSLELLDSGAEPARVLLIFDLLLLAEAGFRPGFQTCIACGEALAAEPNAFDLERGGFVCGHCGPAPAGARVVPVNVQKVMRMIDRGDIGQVLAVRVPTELFEQAERLVAEYVATITGRDSTATRVIRDLRLEYDYRSDPSEVEERDVDRREATGP